KQDEKLEQAEPVIPPIEKFADIEQPAPAATITQPEEIFSHNDQPTPPESSIPPVEIFADIEQPAPIETINPPEAVFTQIETQESPELPVPPEEVIVPAGKPDETFTIAEPAPLPEISIPADIFAPPEEEPVIQAAPKEIEPLIEKPVTSVSKPAKRVSAPPVSKPTHKPAKPLSVSDTNQRRTAGSADLARAREATSHGDIATALRRYIKLVNANRSLDFVSSDLKDLVRKNPKNYLAWQTYGDARLRSNRIQEALDAYAKAADLLK
ncbi:MAG TPA: hypothetical protein VF338_10335, partial [Leptolinea sp.]